MINESDIAEHARLAQLNERGLISRAEYIRMRELEGTTPQVINDAVAFIFDHVPGDIETVPDNEQEKKP